MRLSVLSLTLFGTVVAVAGCGDDSGGTPDASTPIDSRMIDASTPDAPPDAEGFKGFFADEAGEVRMEYVAFANGNASARITNFVYNDPGTMRFWPYLAMDGCTDTSMDDVWPVAHNANDTYYDPGNVIIAGGPNTFTLGRRPTAGNDNAGRPHPANGWGFSFPGMASNDAAMTITEKTTYDVIFTGSADMPAQVFDNALYMPAAFQVISPDMQPFALPAGQPQTFTSTVPTDSPPAGTEVMSTIVFTPGAAAGGPVVVCVEPHDGSVTVPANMIDIVRAKVPNGGTLARQTIVHQVRELVDNNGPTGRRIDFVGVWCYTSTFTVPAI